ncbi:extracellular solute-binding protein [Candidimonas nitroreducens]|uniref:sn-glycerol-3-phosphate-binding periplasmic protein UgpB n=1 Tax=Candidimonas nitroreducens TaxID=683354 RepID=A0A225MXD1_9BURK|nr:extracellular solute-binding protein [Candidimonas nitroreducens]OWT65732.1 glycerol-3-phosphate ABC transporter substrate-binding protein [Candidimonas nitroreducens]
MKTYLFSGTAARLAAAVLGTAALSCAAGANAATNIEVWYSLNPHNRQVFEKLVGQFNRKQDAVHVALKSYDNNEALESALAVTAHGKSSPNLVQLDDNHAPDELAQRSYILPLYQLLAKYPIKNAKWFLAPEHAFMRDSRGRLLAFPYMVDIPVMYYNVGAFKTAGLSPATPQRTWIGLQGQLVQLANHGSRKCPYITDQPVSINLENLAAVNNQLYLTDDNGLAVKASTKARYHYVHGKKVKIESSAGAPRFPLDLLYIRHLSMMVTWARNELMVKPLSRGNPTQRFADRECAVLTSSSSNIGQFRDARGLDFGVSGLPYYPEATQHPGDAFVAGSALWAIDKHPAAENKATAELLGWLAQPDNGATWYQNTGFLPVTAQAYEATPSSYYKNLGSWQSLVDEYAKKPTSTERGFKVANYPQIKAMFRSHLERALNGQDPAVTALGSAGTEANRLASKR